MSGCGAGLDRPRIVWAAVAVVCFALLAACGGGGTGAATTTSPATGGSTTTTTSPGTGGGRTPKGSPIGKIRIANLINVKGQPGPAVDLYDTDKFHVDPSYQPLIKGLKYGEVSDYVSPRGWASGDTTSNLYLFPAGSQTPTALLSGSNIDNSGFEAGDQITIALFAVNDGTGFGSVSVVEAGSRQGPTETTVPSPQGSVAVRSAFENPNGIVETVAIDGTCAGDITSVIGVTAGSHTFGILTSSPGHGLTTCAGVTPVNTATADVGAGKEVEVFVYGDPSAPEIIAAPVG